MKVLVLIPLISLCLLPSLNLFKSAKEHNIQKGRSEGEDEVKLEFSRFLSHFKALTLLVISLFILMKKN